jgi:transposase
MAYQSHNIQYYRIVESFRKEGKPHIRVLARLGRVDDILQNHRQQAEGPVKISSVSAGAVTALHRLAQELDVTGRINRAIAPDDDVQIRDGLPVGESLLAVMIARACAPRSKRAFADWAKTTYLPALMNFVAADLTSQHFRDQMNALPVDQLTVIEQGLVREVARIEQLHWKALAYDRTNFYTNALSSSCVDIASTNLRPELPQRGHNKQGRHDLRQMGLALVVDQETQLPLAHELYAGARTDMKTFDEFLKPVRKFLRELTGQPEQLTIVFDAGASSRQNLETMEPYVTAVRPSDHRALLAEAVGNLAPVQLAKGTQRTIAGKQREVVVVFSPQLHQGQLRGLQQSQARWRREAEELGFFPRVNVDAAKRKLAKNRSRQYLRPLLDFNVDHDEQGATRVSVWSDWPEYQRLTTRYFGLRILVSDRAEWSTAQIIEAYRGQSKAESAVRDLKDPRMLSTQPQFHWTDRKLHVHAFMCVATYLLVTLLHLRATQNTGFQGSSRRLLAELAEVRCCQLVDMTGRKGRPRVRLQFEQIDPVRQSLVESLGAVPDIK